jgi:hypothetical protein
MNMVSSTIGSLEEKHHSVGPTTTDQPHRLLEDVPKYFRRTTLERSVLKKVLMTWALSKLIERS